MTQSLLFQRCQYCLCFLDASTDELLFACCLVGVGTYKRNLYYFYCNVRKVVWFSATYKLIQLHPNSCTTLLIFRRSTCFEATYKTPPTFIKNFEETLKISPQQTNFRLRKFNMNHLKSFKKCLGTYKVLQNFLVFSTRNSWAGITIHLLENYNFFPPTPWSIHCQFLIQIEIQTFIMRLFLTVFNILVEILKTIFTNRYNDKKSSLKIPIIGL